VAMNGKVLSCLVALLALPLALQAGNVTPFVKDGGCNRLQTPGRGDSVTAAVFG